MIFVTKQNPKINQSLYIYLVTKVRLLYNFFLYSVFIQSACSSSVVELNIRFDNVRNKTFIYFCTIYQK